MNSVWRLCLAALRFVTHRPLTADEPSEWIPSHRAARFIPLGGILIGAAGAAVLWLSAQLWPASIAVVLAMLATAWITGEPSRTHRAPLYWIFLVLIKYNALMALSSASLPVPLPELAALGIVMIAAHAASHALVVSMMATHAPMSLHISTNDLAVALVVGLAPAALLGIPGLIGLVAAILARIAFTAAFLRRLPGTFREHLDGVRHASELCFYLGALAAWKYV